jgi:hypothetical protein
LNDKERFRDHVLYILTGEKSIKQTGRHGYSQSERLTRFKNELIEKAIERSKQNQSAENDSQSDILEIVLAIKDLQKRVADLEDKNRLTATTLAGTVSQLHLPTQKYADSIIDGKFNRVTDQANDDTVFELQLPRADSRNAEFTIYENAKRRALKNPDFIDGCEKQRINPNPVDLQVENGVATLQDNGKWQITQKAKVKFV